MRQDVNSDVQAQLLQLKRGYLQRLEKEFAELCSLAGQTRNDHGRKAWRQIRERLHRLAGSAGTFGIIELGNRCRRLEQRLDTALQAEDDHELTAIRQAVCELDANSQAGLADFGDIESKPVSNGGPDPAAGLEQPRVFVLEDDRQAGEQIGQILESFHYAVQLFTSGQALLKSCQTSRPDALILDLHLSEGNYIDGLAIGEAIQAEMDPPLPLFMVAQSQDFDVQLRAVRAGVEAFFTQPVEPIRLADALGKHLRLNSLPPARVLMVDDDEALLAYHRLVLEAAGFSVMTASQPREALKAMDTFAPEVLVLDVRMPECSGPELAQIVRYHARWLQVPIVYLSASSDAAAQLSAMTKAGDDFLIKPIAPELLVASVTARARRARMLSAALSRDGLTGLLKHADIKERLASAIAHARRNPQPLCAVMVDIDHFKRVNDTYGHLTGDEVIRALANLLRRRLRESDLIGRYGGEEFLVVLHDCEAIQASRILDQLRQTFAQLRFGRNEAGFSCTFSAGVAELQYGHDVDTLVGEADRHLYRAKQGGRNRVEGAE